ncbi:hypothetical protein [Acinetobacter sp. NBRC 100985]|uniref:hypothetical protein n=1 Tax=Acinetobacter sp. NBRC 100985 TaxID=1071390 RepID=UPI0003059224|nr:hypothetical protein [Acinetobacter sp. NBRC 100985]
MKIFLILFLLLHSSQLFAQTQKSISSTSREIHLDIPILSLFSDFSSIQSEFSLQEYRPNKNYIQESKHYFFEAQLVDIKLTEWKGKLHEINYTLKTEDPVQLRKIQKYLFEQYKKNFEWELTIDNGFGKFYENSNKSILGIYSYSFDPTVSFLSNELRVEETKRRFPHLNE